MDNSGLILLQLLLAHILTDFVFQPSSWVKHKRKYKITSGYLYLHAFLAGFLTYLLLQQWELWPVALIVSVTHFFIDLWKLQKERDSLKIFLLDQLLHLLVLLIIWLFLTDNAGQFLPFLAATINNHQFLFIFTAYVLVIFPVGFIIGKATRRWQNELEEPGNQSGLQDAGRYIGMFERILVLTFILTSNFSAIGFLIAAKSILRFNDKAGAGARKQTEYVLIGTLMSFSITIILGLLVYYLAL